MQPEEALVLAPGAVGQVGALHPGAGVLVEGLLASVSVDPAAAGPPLSNREKEILRLQALGYSNREMANMLAVSLRTIEAGRARAKRVLGLTKRTELVRFAFENSLAEWD